MSDGDRSGKPKAGLIATLLFALASCAGFIGYGLSQSAEYERQADNKRYEYSEYTRKKIAETCVGIPKAELVQCRYEAFDAKREYDENQSDLEAQRKSALWAYIMGVAAVIGIALSAIGVWLIKTTFDETRRSANAGIAANRLTLERSIEDSRPFLYIESVKIEEFSIGPDCGNDPGNNGAVLRVLVTIKNIGGGIAVGSLCCIAAGPFPISALDNAQYSYFNGINILPGEVGCFPITHRIGSYIEIFPEESSSMFLVALNVVYGVIELESRLSFTEYWSVGRELYQGQMQNFLRKSPEDFGTFPACALRFGNSKRCDQTSILVEGYIDAGKPA